LLIPDGDLVIVLSTVLRIRRTLDGTEIDKIIWDMEAQKALAAERRRRADWCKCELAASRFRAECHHADAAASSQRQIGRGSDNNDQQARRTYRPDDLEGPRRANRRGHYCDRRRSTADPLRRKVRRLRCHQLPSNTGLSLVISICETLTPTLQQ
jgi:hypothetical protein